MWSGTSLKIEHSANHRCRIADLGITGIRKLARHSVSTLGPSAAMLVGRERKISEMAKPAKTGTHFLGRAWAPTRP
jgi:hypothetical protein